MKLREIFKRESRNNPIAFFMTDNSDLCVPGFTPMDQVPEIQTACRRIAELIGSMTIHLMENKKNGDVRIVNELARMIDVTPEKHMTRSTWMQGIVMTLLLYGKGNAIVQPHTYKGYLEALEPIAAERVQLLPEENSFRKYKIAVDGKIKSPSNLLHFVYNPDKRYLWKGQGVTVSLKALADSLKQADKTKNVFMRSEWKPSIIVKVDALTEEFASPTGRQKLLESYTKPAVPGEPWLIPAEQFSVEQVRPLSLADLAIKDTVEMDKRTVAAILGVPPFLLGVGEFNREAWNNFIQNTIRLIALSIAQEMTNKLILSPSWYLKFNVRSLMDWDLNTLSNVYGGLSDRGIVDGNEVRDVIGMSPREGLDELRLLENYLPIDRLGDQKKLVQGVSDETDN